jgi:hypothetical protein
LERVDGPLQRAGPSDGEVETNDRLRIVRVDSDRLVVGWFPTTVSSSPGGKGQLCLPFALGHPVTAIACVHGI